MNWLIEKIQNNGSLSIFIGGFLEEVVVPIPSPLVSMAGGALLVGEKDFVLGVLLGRVVLPFALGATLGSSFVYLLAFWGGRLLIDRMEKYLGFNWDLLEKTRGRLMRGLRDELAIIFLRAVPVIPVSLISGVCGAIRLEWKEFYLCTFIGLMIRSFILSFLGWYLGEAYMLWVEGLDRVEDWVALVLAFLGVAALGFLYYKRRVFWASSKRGNK